MSTRTDILSLTENFINEHEPNSSPEEMFLRFEIISTLHREFEAYLVNEKIIYNLNKMNRNERLKEKRKLFAEWYIKKNQDKKMMKEMLYELSEMFFITKRRLENILFYETTE